MKNLKVLFLFFTFFLVFPFTVNAQEYSIDGVDAVEEALPDEVGDILDSYGISPNSTEWAKAISSESVFSHISSFIKSGIKAPLKTAGTALAIVVVIAAITSLSSKSEISSNAVFLCGLSLIVFLVAQVYGSVKAAATAIKGSATFMMAFVPMYAGIIAVSGGVASSVTMSSLLLVASEVSSALAAYIIVPLMSGYLALSVSTAASPLINSNAVGESVKKIALWVLSFITTIFLGVLGIQTTVNSAADSLALRTSKFLIGTAAPVAGPALSEAVATVSTSMQLLKSTAGIYGVIALVLLLLPIIIELLPWRISMMLLGIISEILDVGKVTTVFKSIDSMLALLIGITMLIAALFIISLTVVVSQSV